ncbi:hypothetical protein LGV61_04000 [Desulfurispirillum indicum]|uniref:hypothetical protein n=1 Tax=Desulfurispirillum indicum TaxID=936456 RepID=UPI001CFA00C3|nr:hypothetical protein [Desulfurispirillum indicum]UCZ57449.1 hypothetical protein LGV61_04000 [Desulfurispirillum indicum]
MNPKTQKTVSYREIILFSIPLLFTTQFMSISHTLINAFLARQENQVEILAGFGLGITLYLFIASLSYANSHIAASYVRGRQSLRTVLSFSILLGVFIAAIVSLISISGIANFLFVEVFQVPWHIAEYAVHTMLYLIPLSLFTSLRGSLQGILAKSRKPTLITVGVIIRIGSLLVLLPMLLHFLDGVAVGALGLLGGIAIESAAIVLFCWQPARRLNRLEEGDPMGYGRLIGFALPLMYSMSMQHLSTLLVNGMVARLSDSALGLAAFTIVRGFIFLFYGPFQSLQQTVITLAENRETLRRIVLFAIALLAGLSVALLSIQFLFHHTVLTGWMAIEAHLVEYLRWPVLLTTGYGILYCTNHLLKATTTRELKTLRIGASSTIKILCVMLASLAMLSLGIQGNGALLGVALLILGELAEVAVLLWVGWRQRTPVEGYL